MKALKITHAIPKFVGPDLNEYGPFDEGDEVKLPDEIAEVLVNKGRAD